jgi:nucleoside-diphosphate-sugar epimerase
MGMKVLILGINGFIGYRLTENILSKTDWEVYGMDLAHSRLGHCLRYPQLHFKQGDITKEKDWIKEQLTNCDVILPLAIITPSSSHVIDPLHLFELNFEMNLEIIKFTYHAKKRLIFPSTSELYGIGNKESLDEETSNLVLGPIFKEQWIGPASKQLLDRVIYAFGKHRGMKFTLFRPLNWIGPNQDEIFTEIPESSHIVTRFISNIIHKQNIVLFNGGIEKRSFTYIDDGIEAVMRIIENKNNHADGQIFNLGNPHNTLTIRELAEKIKQRAKSYPKYRDLVEEIEIVYTDQHDFDESYQEMKSYLPSIEKAKKLLGWDPRTDIDIALNNTLDFYFV